MSSLDSGFVEVGRQLAQGRCLDHCLELGQAKPSYGRVEGCLSALPEPSRWLVWNSLLVLEELDEVLEHLPGDLRGEERVRLVRFFSDAAFCQAEVWPEIRRQSSSVVELVASVQTEFRGKALQGLELLLRLGGAVFLQRCPIAFAVVRRLSAPPFDPELHPFEAIRLLVLCSPPEGAGLVLQAPDPCFRFLERVARRPNRLRLTCRGLRALLEVVPDEVAGWFVEFPHPLLRMAALLGSLPLPAARGLVREHGQHALFDPELLKLELLEVADRLLAVSTPGIRSPLPQGVLDYYTSERPIPDFMESRLRESLARKLSLSRIEFLRGRAAAAQRDHGDPPLPEATSEGGSRALVQLLQAAHRGQSDWREHRAETVAWRRRHPELDLAGWRKGLRWEEASAILAPAGCLAEVLSLAGPPAALDENKQLVLARTQAGRLLGWALLGLTRDGTVTFLTTPPAELESAFRDYARRLASKLGLKVGSGDVERLVHDSWYGW